MESTLFLPPTPANTPAVSLLVILLHQLANFLPFGYLGASVYKLMSQWQKQEHSFFRNLYELLSLEV